jgi:transcriptional regulator with XRE-family HTH domain
MGTKPRDKPAHLAEKLLAIRQELEASQSEMSALLGHYITPARVSEWERGIKEPNLMILLSYARLARVEVEVLIDDKRELPQRFKGLS